MPELPEVETVVRGLIAGGLIGRRLESIVVRWDRTVHTHTAAEFTRRLRGQNITAIRRRAKYIVVALSGGQHLLIHLRMTGRLQFAAPADVLSRHDHVVLRLDDDRELRFHDTRKFGRWSLVDNPETSLRHVGPEPLSNTLTAADFAAMMRAHARLLKPLLLDQRVIAGLGNIYVDEALWDARLHPRRRSNTLTRAEAQRLYRGIRKVLQRGIDAQGTSLGDGQTNFYSVAGRRGRNQDGLRVFRHTGDPCPRCRAPIKRIVVGQRGTHLCPRCQPRRK